MSTEPGPNAALLAPRRVFLSHATEDRDEVDKLREALVSHGVEIAPRDAAQMAYVHGFVVLVTRHSTEDARVENEVSLALTARWAAPEARGELPLVAIARGVGEKSARRLFVTGDHADASAPQVLVAGEGEAIEHVVPRVLAALGMAPELSSERAAPASMPALTDLVVELTHPRMELHDGARRAVADARVVLRPPVAGARVVEGEPARLEAPLGALEADDLRWYLEEFPQWPYGLRCERAARVEKALPAWGRRLFDAALGAPAHAEPLRAFQSAGRTERRVTIKVDDRGSDGTEVERREAAARLLALPWELLHDGTSYLFEGARGARVRRRLPSAHALPEAPPSGLPLRVLFVLSRPEDERAAFLDPRASLAPLAAVLDTLGPDVELTVLPDGSFEALAGALEEAYRQERPYHVVHFDGHGVYDPVKGLGALVFEDEEDVRSGALRRKAKLVGADRIGATLRDHRVPLFVLEACQTAKTEEQPHASVAAALLRAGVASVVAMSHSVLVETARRFVEAFYGGLVAGERIGTAMATAQRALQRNRVRGELDPQAPWKQRGGDARGEGGDLERQDGGDALEAGGAGPRGGLDAGMRGGGDAGLRGERDAASGRLELDDWLVPVLFQEGDGDPPLVPGGADTSPLARHARQLRAEQVRGKLPPPPPHTFVGRGRELLAIDRALVGAPEGGRLLALVGPGGLGKTALAAETARFLLAIRRVQRVAFASVEQLSDARGVVAAIGEQLVPGYVIATAERTGRDEEKLHNAMLPIEKALWGMRALIVIDNLESILPAPGAEPSDEVKAVLGVLWRLAKAGETRVVLTSRESVPAVLGAAGGGTGVGSVAARAAGTAGEGLGAASAAVEAHAQGGATLELRLGRLGRREAMELLRAVLRRHDLSPAGEAGQEQVEALVETVGGHARSLVLLAREVASRGLGAVADDVREAMRALERRHPGATDEQKRELSVIASVNLSLRRLPEAVRRQIRPLAVFHGPAHVAAIAHVLEMKPDGALRLCGLLMAVGLADAEGPYLLPDPALGAALAEDFTVEERAAAEARWLEAVEAFVAFLYEQQFKDARVATQGARTTLADVLAALHQIVAQVDGGVRDAAKAIHFVTSVEALVRLLGLPRVLRRISAARQGIAARLSAWSHARFAAESQEFERKLEAGDLPGALRAARAIHAEMEAVGDAYPEAAYDRAMSWFRLGRVLRSGGAAEQALDVLRQAEKRFEALAASHGEAAARMASTAITDQGDALLDLGRLDEAAAAYERATRQAESLGDLRSVAVSQGQLGTVRMLQGRHDDAIAAHAEARETFEKLGEPGSVATAWHQIGRVHQEAQRFDAAEAAYRRSLALQVARGNKAGEAAALLQLGSLYDDQGQLDEAAKYYRQVVELRRALGDKQGEGRAQTNLGVTLHRLRRFGEARAALKGALALKMDMGHASEPWNTWAVLARVERDAGCPGAAGEAHDQAMASYRAYRTDGGEPMRADTRLIAAFGQVLRTQGADAVLAVLAKIDDTPAWLHPVLESLRSLAAGDRDPGLAADPRLEPEAAVELALVLEALTAPS